MSSKRWLAGCAVAVSALLAAGCGGGTGSGSAPGAAALARQMRSAIRNATSVHVSGTAAGNGQQVHLNLSLTRAGGMSGTVALGQAQVTILVTGGKAYTKLTPSALSAMHLPISTCGTFCNKYLVLPASDAAGLTGGMGWSQLMNPSTFSGTARPGTKVTGPFTINGQQAWKVSDSSGTGYVAAHGPAYPLRIIAPRGQGPGQIDFTQWNSATIPGSPPASQQVTLSQLHG
ncbi:MAG: hypothetical protein ACM32E_22375 [Gemmatimonadota bacterium]